MKKRSKIVNMILLLLISVLSFGLVACNTTPETEHTHVFNIGGVCVECGYEKPHEHSWSDEWSNNKTHHWHSPACNDTDELKDKAEHSFVGNICSECHYNRTIPEAAEFPQTDFMDVGEKFNTVVTPLYNAAETILSDLVESEDVVLREERNPRIVGIRYCYGISFVIIIREDIFIEETGEKSEFLQAETGIELENFGEDYDDTYLAYKNFLIAERKSQSLTNYESFLTPYAQKSAELILAQYELYKNHKEITFLNYGKQLTLSAESSLAETYNKIVANLNSALDAKDYPLITDQDLNFGFGGNIYWEIVNRWILIETSVGNLNYSFYISFNESGEFSADFINYYQGTKYTGYTPGDVDMFNPADEEYSELFERLKIDEIDLSNIESSYKYDGNGNALYDGVGEHTFLYF